jgi:hypothetical protein
MIDMSKFLSSNAKVAKLAGQRNSAVADFDYTSPAELFTGKGRGSSGGSHMTYRRFPTSAEAIKYAVETLKADSLASAALVVGEDRYSGAQIRELYDATRYPISRKSV